MGGVRRGSPAAASMRVCKREGRGEEETPRTPRECLILAGISFPTFGSILQNSEVNLHDR